MILVAARAPTIFIFNSNTFASFYWELQKIDSLIPSNYFVLFIKEKIVETFFASQKVSCDCVKFILTFSFLVSVCFHKSASVVAVMTSEIINNIGQQH